jgi:hypothetical protein
VKAQNNVIRRKARDSEDNLTTTYVSGIRTRPLSARVKVGCRRHVRGGCCVQEPRYSDKAEYSSSAGRQERHDLCWLRVGSVHQGELPTNYHWSLGSFLVTPCICHLGPAMDMGFFDLYPPL